MRRHALLVLGMHRSGTSALTGALAKAGANPGKTLMAPTADNPEGYWEDATLVGFNDQLLRQLGARWDSIAPLPESWPKLPLTLAAREQAADLIAAEWGDAKLAVIKDPRLCRLLPLWRAVLVDAGFIVSCVLMTRRPTAVARSLARRDQFAPEKSLALWLAHLTQAERDSRGLARAFVTYEALLADPAAAFDRVCTDAAFPLKPAAADKATALAVVKPELNRQRARVNDATRGGMASALDTILDAGYDKLAALAQHVDPKRAIETIALEASTALAAAMPPWLAHELASAQELARALGCEREAARQTIDLLEREIEVARKAHASRDATEASLRASLERAPLTQRDLDAFRDAIVARIEPLTAALAAAQGAATAATAAERAVREELARAQRDLADERATIASLAAQIDQARVGADDYESQMTAARRHIDELVVQIEEARRAHAARDEIEAELTRERDALRHEMQALFTQASKLGALTSEAERLSQDLAIREREGAALAEQARAAEEALAATGAELERRTAAERRLTADRDRLVTLEREARERVAALERNLAAAAADIQMLRGQLDVANASLARVKRRWLGRVAWRLAHR